LSERPPYGCLSPCHLGGFAGESIFGGLGTGIFGNGVYLSVGGFVCPPVCVPGGTVGLSRSYDLGPEYGGFFGAAGACVPGVLPGP
jgi:hypothetical protein